MTLFDFADFCLSFGPRRRFCCSKKVRPKYLSESFFMVKGAALFLQQGNSPQGPRSLTHLHKHAGDLPQHLQVMINLLRCEDRIKLAVRLESAWTDRVRYMVVVYSSGRQDTEENILLGVDFLSKESKSCTIGMVLRLWSDTKIHLDGDGGFSVSTAGKMHIFKPVSVQAMWSALQILHKACEVARRYNYFPGGMALVWATYYESCIASDQSCINEWNAMQDLESTRPDSPALYVDTPTERERAERHIKAKLRSIMMSKDLENVTSKEIRNELEKHMSCNLKEFKEFIDNEMLLILGQMDKPSLIFDHLYLGSEWNASNLEELRGSGVDYILNVTREIDNFFPGLFAYHNIRVYDEETTDLLAHWNEAYHFINKAKKNHSKCLVHCKMGVSRSASTVIAYAMKEFSWSLEKAYSYVQQKRSIARPNSGFMRQLLEYEGILDASKQRHNKLWKQQPEDSLPQNSDSSGGPSDYLLDSLDVDLDPPCQSSCADPRVSQEAVGFHYCFRRLSDSLPGNRESFFQVADRERDLLLEEADSAITGLPFLEFVDKSEVEKLKGKEKAEVSGLGEKTAKRNPEVSLLKDGAVPRLAVPEERSPGGEEKPTERWKRRSSVQEEGRLNAENLNNNNSKRSCPEDFEHDAIFGILNKVKPPYKSCADCMYATADASAEAFGDSRENLHPVSPCHSSAVCTQPSFLSHRTPTFLEQAFCESSPKEIRRAKTNSLPSMLVGSDLSGIDKSADGWPCSAPEKPTDIPKLPVGALLGLRNSLCERSPVLNDGLKEDCSQKKDTRQTKDLKYLLFSKDLEKPATNSYLMQHQESLLQLQKAGLVRKHTKELERLKGLPLETPVQARECPGALTDTTIPEEPQELVAQQDQLPLPGPSPSRPEDVENYAEKLQKTPLVGMSQKTSTPILCRMDHTSSFTKDFLKTICYTPSSSRSSNLTRSSSSDSIHSVRGKPGLVKQRTQEIETRLRLAGLTVSSPLKRSNSLAKLGSLNLSSEDLTSDADLSALADSRETKSSESSVVRCDFHPSLKAKELGSRPLAKASLVKLKGLPWMGES
ncbi:protein phosphatase Slingshot homolog 1 isoform X2 [Rhineura floridana]|uniref:protein phosphatase Slingshot homolog 1 isoform X2 n=1 Tax=Rhineura floridana TaxID=261503 RepID=UPI002AC87E5F|nr:protein phosphatase Slingshot homolog 1 isoform X2 [Rhineura floridana]